jgi:hypothetical protein
MDSFLEFDLDILPLGDPQPALNSFDGETGSQADPEG